MSNFTIKIIVKFDIFAVLKNIVYSDYLRELSNFKNQNRKVNK